MNRTERHNSNRSGSRTDRAHALSVPGLCLAVGMLMLSPGLTRGAEPDFARDVRPILSKHCFKCHGPDETTRKGDLRLDVREEALKAGASGERGIIPGEADASELIRRIQSSDPNEQMPPPDNKLPLSDAQKKTLTDWISAGADYKPHWAFQPPQAAPLPEVKQTAWPRVPFDRFVLAQLERKGLAPSPEADRETLIRRVYLDLIGIPPTIAEVDAFLSDPNPRAYENLVDGLLARPQYGERWARRWLDLARYADTNGYEKDRTRSIWPYRDWVINALNDDLPFDQFSIEQLAGDLLPNAGNSQRVATGFHRNTMLNEEGGIDPLEFRYYAMVDRVNTTATVWMGLTFACSHCHNHKYDPLTQQDYYGLYAYLNNADEPLMDLPSPALTARRAELDAEIARQEATLLDQFPLPASQESTPAKPLAMNAESGARLTVQPDQSLLVSGPQEKPADSPDKDRYTLTIEIPARSQSDLSEAVAGLQLVALNDPSLPSTGPGRTEHGNFVITELSVSRPKDGAAAELNRADAWQPLKLARAEADFSQEKFPAEHVLDGNAQTGWAIHGPGKWNVRRTLTVWFDQPVLPQAEQPWRIQIDQSYGSRHTLGRFQIAVIRRRSDARPEAEQRAAFRQQKFDQWLQAETARTRMWQLVTPLTAKSNLPLLTIESDGSVFASGDMSKRDLYELQLPSLKGVTAIRLEALPDDRLPSRGPGRVYYEGPFGDFFLSEVEVASKAGPLKLVAASQSRANGNSTADRAIDGDQQTGWSIAGGQGQPQTAVFRLSEPVPSDDPVELKLLFERYYAAGLGRFRIWVTRDTEPAEARPLPVELDDLFRVPAKDRTAGQMQQLQQAFAQVVPELAPARARIDALRQQRPAFTTTLVLQERPPENPRITRVYKRGEFLQPQGEVSPHLPAAFRGLLPAGASEPKNRLEFARWLVSPQNPLVARVTVNRQWQALFGRGLVRTTEDFGFQGELPLHPQLLDWLAVDFMKQGWSMKKLHRQLVLSATYRQSSRVTPELWQQDPQNLLFARGPRVRVEGELVRDIALQISGLLSHRLGGPSVFPPQPAGVTSEGTYGSLSWTVSSGEDRYRRGLYTFAKRTAPYAMFGTFDAPSGEACVPRREQSNTPLQALTVLNDQVFLEAAQALGKSLATASGSEPERVATLYRRALSRRPQAEEISALQEYLKQQREQLRAGTLDSAAISGAKDLPDAERIETAAWTLAARVILNLDETICKE